ncbi:hypothetical protein MHYP_G00238330 [Metynnis hypsauchen]
MGSVTSALARTRPALLKVKVGSEPQSERRDREREEPEQEKKEKEPERKKAQRERSAVANEDGESNSRPLATFARSKSQNALWNSITAGMGIKEKVRSQKSILDDSRSPEEILAEDFPPTDGPDAMEKTAVSMATLGSSLSERISFHTGGL